MDHPQEFVIVRHAQAVAGTAGGRFPATSDDARRARSVPDHLSPLTPLGREQARLAGQNLVALLPFDIVFDTPLLRTVETADRVMAQWPEPHRTGTPRETRYELRERNSGWCYAVPKDLVKAYFPIYSEAEQGVGDPFLALPGGETILDVWDRAHAFWVSARAKRAGERILVVAHARVIQCLVGILERMPFREFCAMIDRGETLPNCGILRYVYDQKVRRYVRISVDQLNAAA